MKEEEGSLPQRTTREIIQEVPAIRLALDKAFIKNMSGATPSVINLEKFKGNNAGAVTVTQFVDGQEGQVIKILGDGFMTITHGANIKTNSGANKLLLANVVYTFTRINGVWVENEAGGSSAVSSVFGRTGAVVAAAGDYDAFYFTEAEVTALLALGGEGMPHAGTTDITVWYVPGASPGATFATITINANSMRLLPFIAPARGGTLDRIAAEVTTGIAGNLRVGLYEPKGQNNIYPGALLEDSGDISTAAAAIKSFNVTRVLTPGKVYWLAINTSVNVICRSIQHTGYNPILGITGAAGAPVLRTHLVSALAYGAFSNPFPGGATETTGNSWMPLVRFSA